MSSVHQVLLVDVEDAVSELKKLGFTVDDDDCMLDNRIDHGNGGTWEYWDRPTVQRELELSTWTVNPVNWDEVAYLIYRLIITDEQRESGLPIFWRTSW